LQVPIVYHPIDDQSLCSGTDNWRQRIRSGRLESSEDNHCLQKRRFAERIRANDAGNLRIEIQLESRETAKVPYGKMTKHEIPTANGRQLTRKQKTKSRTAD
jgi:hypothetical protein